MVIEYAFLQGLDVVFEFTVKLLRCVSFSSVVIEYVLLQGVVIEFTKGNNFLKLPWDPETMGSRSPQLEKLQHHQQQHEIIITAIVSRSMRMLIRCFWAFSLPGNGWTKAPDGQWWSMTGRFNVNNRRHPFHFRHQHQHHPTLF